MQITHEEARKLIQFSHDRALQPEEKNMLRAHLEACLECQSYSDDINAVENLLLPVMRTHWNLRPAPLSITSLVEDKHSNWGSSISLTTRTTLIGIVLAVFFFSAWQFARSGNQTSRPMPIGLLPIPTPAGQSTSTMISLQNCEETIYQIQENDTLESIALRFSISKTRLMSINNMKDETVRARMRLLIPICQSTPTGTIHPSTLTITFTPFIDSTTSTPGG
jgi:hypothetical protein